MPLIIFGSNMILKVLILIGWSFKKSHLDLIFNEVIVSGNHGLQRSSLTDEVSIPNRVHAVLSNFREI